MAASSSDQHDVASEKFGLSDTVQQNLSAIQSLAKRLTDVLESERQKIENWNKASVKLEVSQLPNPIIFNVGGTKFAASVETLSKIPGTYFANLVSGRWELKRSEDGSIFIDRSPTSFGYLMDFLRDYPQPFSSVYPLLTPLERLRLGQDCEFYMIPELVDSLFPAPPALPELKKLLNVKSMRFLYQWSVDGPGHKVFHQKCDQQGPTVVMTTFQDGRILGAFTSLSWTSGTQTWFADASAFLFTGTIGDATMKILRQTGANPGNAVLMGADGPYFGSSPDMSLVLDTPPYFNGGCGYSSSAFQAHNVPSGTGVKDVHVFAVQL